MCFIKEISRVFLCVKRLTLLRGGVIALATAFIYFVAGAQPRGDQNFIDSLMGEMTLKEKIGQLNLLSTGSIVTTSTPNDDNATEKIRRGEVGAVLNLQGVKKIRELQEFAVKETRLGIPMFFGKDVIHGYETLFPIPLAMSCSWDMDAIVRMARISAIEASADGLNWTFSPMVDISKDARWGRVAEGSGEDPWLGAQIARAMVKGYQGDSMNRNDEIMACVKHFALYGAPEGGRDYNMVDMSRNRMFNEYFLPYKAAVEAGAASVMSSFNDVNGVPATVSRWLLTDLLRDRWRFDGFVTTDNTAIMELPVHSIGDIETVTARALKAGTDLDMNSQAYIGQLEKAVVDGLVSEEDINRACRRILEAKMRLGLFDNPFKYISEDRAATEIYTPSHRNEARRIAAKTFVLLKNNGNLLPLSPQGRIALIGPHGNARTQITGMWSGVRSYERYETVFEAMKRFLDGKAEVRYARGSNLDYDPELEERAWVRNWNCYVDGRQEFEHGNDKELLDEAMEVAAWADVIVATLGEAMEMSGESSCRTDLEMPAAQQDLLKALLSTGKPVVLLHFSGRPTVMKWEDENVAAIMNVWFPGSEAGNAICDVLFGDIAPSGRLTTSFPQASGQCPFYCNHRNTSRPQNPSTWFEKYRSNYLDVPNEPVYPFGYGLTYTTFAYSPIELSDEAINAGGSLTAKVYVTNTGSREGTEVVQLYLRDIAGSITRPVQELKGFERIVLKPGETREVTFAVDLDMLMFYDENLNFVAEPGEFELMIGPNCRDVERRRFRLVIEPEAR